MTLGSLLLFGHIVTMIAAVTISYGPSFLVRLAARSGQVAAIRGVSLASKPLGPFIPIAFVTGGILGLLTAINFGFNLLTPWLVIAYALWLVAMIAGITVNAPFAARLGAAVAGAPDGAIPSSVSAVLADPTVRAVAILDYVVIIALVFDMVVKPFS